VFSVYSYSLIYRLTEQELTIVAVAHAKRKPGYWIWTLGFGGTFDASRLRTFPPGSYYRLPAGVPHFHAAGAAETIVQIESVGPSAREFVHPDDARERR
jgi:hypothetical protein